MKTASLLLSLVGIGYPGDEFLPADELVSATRARNGDVIVVGSRAVVASDGDDDWFHMDMYIARVAPDHKTILWEKTLGSIYDDKAEQVFESADGSLLIRGRTLSPGNKRDDFFVLLDVRGQALWRSDQPAPLPPRALSCVP